jgi:hypothetical protein
LAVRGRGHERKPAGPTADEARKVVVAALIGAAEGAGVGKRKSVSKLISLAHKVCSADALYLRRAC